MGHPVRIKLTNNGLLIQLANHYTITRITCIGDVILWHKKKFLIFLGIDHTVSCLSTILSISSSSHNFSPPLLLLLLQNPYSFPCTLLLYLHCCKLTTALSLLLFPTAADQPYFTLLLGLSSPDSLPHNHCSPTAFPTAAYLMIISNTSSTISLKWGIQF